MTRAFVVNVEVDPSEDLQQIAALIKDTLDPLLGEVAVNAWDSTTQAPVVANPTFPTL